MSVLDKFLSIMKLDDEDDYDDFFEEDDDDFKPKNKKNFFKRGDSDEDDYVEEKKPKLSPVRQFNRKSSNMEVCVIKPTSVDDAREVSETLLNGHTVILNLEGLDLEIAQRIIDFTAGSTFAISGNLQKIANYIFLVTPTNVDISGDLQDLLNTSFEVPSIKTRF